MKKTLLLVFAGLAATACLTAAAACGEKDTHEHTYSDGWAFDATHHWHPASCEHDAKKDKVEHQFTTVVTPVEGSDEGYTTYTCACGYSYTSGAEGEAPSAGEWQFNDKNHWFASSTESGPQGYEPHDYEESVVAPTCSVAGYTLHACTVCNYWYKDHIVSPTGIHEFDATSWECDASGHWRHATCCSVATSEKVSHEWKKSVSDIDCDGTQHSYTEIYRCECGYFYTENREGEGHVYSEEWNSDTLYHWHDCLCEHASDSRVSGKGEHIFADGNPVCTVCGRPIEARLDYQLNDAGTEYTVTGVIGDLKAANIPAEWNEKAVTKIARGAFKNTGITSLTLPTTITEIPIDLCNGCTELESVTVNGVVTVIGDYAFKGCVKLDMTIPSSVTTIGFSAFNGCKKLTSSLPASLVSIDEYAFKDCTSLTEITIPSTVTTMNGQAFKGCSGLQSVTLDCDFVGVEAFDGCIKLANVTMPNVVSIGAGAFKDCGLLTTLSLPETLVHVGANAFEGSGLITTQNGVVYAAGVATGYDYSVLSITLQSGTIGIADEAFKDFTGLTDIDLGGSLRFIGINAFRRCTSLDGVTFPASVTLIGANAFRQSGIIEVNIPATVKDIGDNAFYDCAALLRAEIHAENIGKFAFSYTGTGRTLDSPVKERPDIAHLTQVVLGDEVISIGSNAFQYCPISEIDLNNVESIGQYAFNQTDLTFVRIPASVNKIGEHAFYDCKLTGVEFEEKSGWKAGSTPVDLSGKTDAEAAALLNTTYAYADWVRSDAKGGN